MIKKSTGPVELGTHQQSEESQSPSYCRVTQKEKGLWHKHHTILSVLQRISSFRQGLSICSGLVLHIMAKAILHFQNSNNKK